MMNTQTFYTWPTGNSYPGEKWRIVSQTRRDVVIQNVEGYRATVSPLMIEVI
jgi:hypothetical protein